MSAHPRGNRGYRYGRWHGGPDPLAPPYDLGNAVDEIGDSVLGGSGVREALRELLRRGTEGRRGLEELRRSVRERLRRARSAGRMDGTLQEVRELLDQALSAERRELFPDPDDSARLAEAELDALPDDTAGAVRARRSRSRTERRSSSRPRRPSVPRRRSSRRASRTPLPPSTESPISSTALPRS